LYGKNKTIKIVKFIGIVKDLGKVAVVKENRKTPLSDLEKHSSVGNGCGQIPRQTLED